jgi:hypothetical protein
MMRRAVALISARYYFYATSRVRVVFAADAIAFHGRGGAAVNLINSIHDDDDGGGGGVCVRS